MERVSCNLCHSRRQNAWRRIGPWQIVRCAECGFAFLSPRPTPQEIGHLLTAERVSRMYDGALERKEANTVSVADRLAVLGRFKKAGSVLDVGCGEGTFLVAAHNLGWATSGVEVLPGPGGIARDRLGPTIYIGDVLDVALPAVSFDAITLWDSLEHMRDPSAVLSRLRTFLKPDGILIARVPNSGSFDSMVHGRKWVHWSVPLHLSHFTPATLRRALNLNGFRVELIDTKISALVWSLRNRLRLRRKGNDPKQNHAPGADRSPGAPLPPESFLFRTLKRIFTGREVTAVARPG